MRRLYEEPIDTWVLEGVKPFSASRMPLRCVKFIRDSHPAVQSAYIRGCLSSTYNFPCQRERANIKPP